MIVIEHKASAVMVTVAGSFTLADYREFEESVLYEIRADKHPDLLFDLSDMLDYTIDVVWEEIKFSRAHRNDFRKIAVVTNSQWTAWATWVARLFVDAEVGVFADNVEAEQWLLSTANDSATIDN